MLDKYTTTELKLKEPEIEKDKIIISNDFYAVCEYLNNIFIKLKEMNK